MDRVEMLLVLEIMVVILTIGIGWSRARYRAAHNLKYQELPSVGWLWRRDPDAAVERARSIHVATIVGAAVALFLLARTLLDRG